MKVFAYLRVSTASQIDGDGFPRQCGACERLASSMGWELDRAYPEQQTGSDEYQDRDKLVALMDDAQSEGVDTIIVERADRIARDLIVSELFFRECKKRGLKVYGADSGQELVNADGDPTRVLIRQILGVLSQWEKSMLVRKLQAGRKRKAAETGKPCGGFGPFGAKREERVIVTYIVMQRRRGKSYGEIANALNRLYLAKNSRGKSRPRPPMPGRTRVLHPTWHVSTVKRLFDRWNSTFKP